MLAAIDREIRQSSALGTVFSEAIADRLGISSSDLECLDLVATGKAGTAGELAAATGLSTGAVTGIVDRLEKAGLARRERDELDRRRVHIRLSADVRRRVEPHYRSLAKGMADLLARYSDDEIALLLDFFTRSHAVMDSEIARLKRQR
jgi:DNA-binding MarR family transcriptional regulator